LFWICIINIRRYSTDRDPGNSSEDIPLIFLFKFVVRKAISLFLTFLAADRKKHKTNDKSNNATRKRKREKKK